MIIDYHDKKTEAFAAGKFVKAFQSLEQQAERRLAVLNAATCLNDLRKLASNHLEALSGDRQGQFSIRINMQWRICFKWPDGALGPSRVEITDYH